MKVPLGLALPLIAAAMPALAAAASVEVTFVVTPPAATPAGATLWISGGVPELGSWSGAGLRLAPRADGSHAGSVRVERGTLLEFKATRGSWDTVEKGPGGEELSNRTHRAEAGDTIRVEVARWREDGGTASTTRRPTRTGDIRSLGVVPSRFVAPREVLVWLPEGYESDRARRYPVLYVQDGNNAFDDSTSFAGEWRLDETAARLIGEGRLPPFIAVAVYNTPDRIAEYTHAVDSKGRGGKGADYGRFLIEELKPLIDRGFRTRPGAEHTAILGSSLGAVIALELAIERPDVFTRVGCVSPAAWWANRDLVARAARAPKNRLRVWVDIGTDEGTAEAGRRTWIEDAEAVHEALRRSGVKPGALKLEIVEGGRHNEAAWAARLDRILEFLLEGLPR